MHLGSWGKKLTSTGKLVLPMRLSRSYSTWHILSWHWYDKNRSPHFVSCTQRSFTPIHTHISLSASLQFYSVLPVIKQSSHSVRSLSLSFISSGHLLLLERWLALSQGFPFTSTSSLPDGKAALHFLSALTFCTDIWESDQIPFLSHQLVNRNLLTSWWGCKYRLREQR